MNIELKTVNANSQKRQRTHTLTFYVMYNYDDSR